MLFQGYQNILDGAVSTIAGAGSTGADATAITAKITIVTGADATVGAILPAGDGDTPAVYLVYSSAATNALKVYPPSGGAINAGSTDAAFSLTARKPCLFVRVSSTQWLAVMSA